MRLHCLFLHLSRIIIQVLSMTKTYFLIKKESSQLLKCDLLKLRNIDIAVFASKPFKYKAQ